MTNKTRRLLEESYEWIRRHPGAMNLDVPDELLHQWILDDEMDSQRSGYPMEVFTFGYVREMLRTDGLPPGQPREISSTRLSEDFRKWQLKLELVTIHRTTEVNIAPLPLFAFPDEEQIEYRPKKGPSAPASSSHAVAE
jgi:hypothetical protein